MHTGLLHRLDPVFHNRTEILKSGCPPASCANLPHAHLQSPEVIAELRRSKCPGMPRQWMLWQGTTHVLRVFLETVLQSWSKYEELRELQGLHRVRWFHWREGSCAHIQQVATTVGKRLQLSGYACCCVGLQHGGIRLLGIGVICSS